MSGKKHEPGPAPHPAPTHDQPVHDRPPAHTTSPAQADQIAAAAQGWQISAPPQLDLGDAVAGRAVHWSTMIFSLAPGQQGPRCYFTLDGDSAITFEGGPNYLPTSSESPSESFRIKLKFLPHEIGRYTSRLDITITDAPVQRFSIPVVAAAHAVGMPTLAEEEAAQEKAARDAAAQREGAASSERVRKAIHDEEQLDTHYHAGHLRQLGNARTRAVTALGALYESRRTGVQAASELVGEYKRHKTPAKPSLLADLAWLAVDLATARIAGSVAETAEAILGATLKRPEMGGGILARGKAEPPEVTLSKSVVGFVSDALKEGVTGGAKAGAQALAGMPGGERANPHAIELSEGERIDFFRLQKDHLVGETLTQALNVGIDVHDALLPVLRVDPELAIAQLEAVADAFKAEIGAASTEHQQQGIEKWIEYVAATNRADQSDAAFDEAHPHAQYDGLIDVQFRPDLSQPEARVSTSGVRINGVSRDAISKLMKLPLMQLGLAVRASGDFDSPSSTVTALRRSNGSVTYATTEGHEQKQWLERKAIAQGRGPDAIWGARILLEQDIMSKTLEEIGELSNDGE